MADLHLDADALGDGAAQVLPRLPGLEDILRLGSASPVSRTWRTALAEELGLRPWASVAPARIAATALRPEAGEHPWFATPVHRSAALDHLRLHPAGLLTLPADELAALAADFAQQYGVAGLALHPLCGGFLLSGFAACGVECQEPAPFLGARLPRALAQGPDAAQVLRLSGDCETWLHDHPVNRRRLQRGLLPVNGLWFWGGGTDGVPLPPTGDLPLQQRVFADDAFSMGLCTLAGGETQQVPADYSALRALVAESSDAQAPAVVVLDSVPRDARDAPLLRLDGSWWQPALAALRNGQLSKLTLLVAGRRCTLRRWHLLRLWSRSKPWWQCL